MNLPTIITGVEPAFNDLVKVYPNPSDDQFTIILPVGSTEDIVVTLVDTYGRAVLGSDIRRGILEKTIDTGSLTSGVYLLQLQNKNGTFRKKIMVMHE